MDTEDFMLDKLLWLLQLCLITVVAIKTIEVIGIIIKLINMN